MSAYLLDGEFGSKARVSAYTSCSILSSLLGCDRDMVADLEVIELGQRPQLPREPWPSFSKFDSNQLGLIKIHSRYTFCKLQNESQLEGSTRTEGGEQHEEKWVTRGQCHQKPNEIAT